jgi:hypothetical protein
MLKNSQVNDMNLYVWKTDWDTFISVTLSVSNAPHNNKFNIQNTTDLIQATTTKIEDETKISVNVTLRHL